MENRQNGPLGNLPVSNQQDKGNGQNEAPSDDLYRILRVPTCIHQEGTYDATAPQNAGPPYSPGKKKNTSV